MDEDEDIESGLEPNETSDMGKETIDDKSQNEEEEKDADGSIDFDDLDMEMEEEETPNFLNTEFVITGVIVDVMDINNADGSAGFRATPNADYTFFDVSPEEFLGFYLNAEIVVSASFHGTAFGILFEKPTYGVARKTGSSRIKEILSLFEMEEYYISNVDNIPEIKCDFKKQRELLIIERNKSINFLKEQLDDGNKN